MSSSHSSNQIGTGWKGDSKGNFLSWAAETLHSLENNDFEGETKISIFVWLYFWVWRNSSIRTEQSQKLGTWGSNEQSVIPSAYTPLPSHLQYQITHSICSCHKHWTCFRHKDCVGWSKFIFLVLCEMAQTESKYWEETPSISDKVQSAELLPRQLQPPVVIGPARTYHVHETSKCAH